MRRKKSKPPAKDPTSLGCILQKSACLPKEQIEAAAAYQKGNGKIMLGEACVRLGFISRHELETAILRQAAMRSGGAHTLATVATQRTRTMSEQIERLTLARHTLVEKLSK